MARAQGSVILRHIRHLVAGRPDRAAPDRELLERWLARRDEDAFAALVDRHGALVLRICRRVLRDKHAAEDAFQAVFLVLSRKAAAITRREVLAGWLYRVAYRIALGLRAEVVRAREGAQRARPAPAVVHEADTRELCAVLDEELNRLPCRYHEPFFLCCVEGRTQDEAARQLGVPLRTLMPRYTKQAQGSQMFTGTLHRSLRTKADGQFQFHGLLAAPYRLLASLWKPTGESGKDGRPVNKLDARKELRVEAGQQDVTVILDVRR